MMFDVSASLGGAYISVMHLSLLPLDLYTKRERKRKGEGEGEKEIGNGIKVRPLNSPLFAKQ